MLDEKPDGSVGVHFLRDRVAVYYADLDTVDPLVLRLWHLAVLCSPYGCFFKRRYGRLGHEGEREKNAHQLADCYRAHQGWLGARSAILMVAAWVLAVPSTEVAFWYRDGTFPINVR